MCVPPYYLAKADAEIAGYEKEGYRRRDQKRRVVMGEKKWRSNNPDGTRFVKASDPQDVQDAAYGVWEAKGKLHKPLALLLDLCKRAYDGEFWNKILFKEFQKVFSYNPVKVARCSDMSVHGGSLYVYHELRKECAPDYIPRKHGCTFPSKTIIGDKLRELNKLGSEALGMKISADGLSTVTDYDHALASIAKELGWLDIDGITTEDPFEIKVSCDGMLIFGGGGSAEGGSAAGIVGTDKRCKFQQATNKGWNLSKNTYHLLFFGFMSESECLPELKNLYDALDRIEQ